MDSDSLSLLDTIESTPDSDPVQDHVVVSDVGSYENLSVNEVPGIKHEVELDLVLKVEPDTDNGHDHDLEPESSSLELESGWSQQFEDDPEFSQPQATSTPRPRLKSPRKSRKRARLSQRLRRSVREILKVIPESEVYRSLFAAVQLERVLPENLPICPILNARKSRGRPRKILDTKEPRKSRGRPKPREIINSNEPRKSRGRPRKKPSPDPETSIIDSEIVDLLEVKSKKVSLSFKRITKSPKDESQKDNSESPPTCDQCNKTFSRSSGLQYHYKSVHGVGDPVVRKYQCKECTKSFIKKSHLTLHVQTHTGESLFACRFCDHKFRGSSARKFHEESVHGDGTSSDKTSKRGRKKSDSSDPQEKSSTNTKVNEKVPRSVFNCSFCDKPFPRIQTKVIHERSHTGEKPYLCTQCGLTFKLQISLREHNKTVHTGERDILCSQCGEGFSRKMSLKYHMLKYHTQRENWHKCTYEGCTQAFVQKQKLERHIKNIHCRGRIKCVKCAKGVDPDKLQKHMELHELREKKQAKRASLPPRVPKKPKIAKVPKKLKIPSRPPPARKLKCNYCDKMFAWPSDRHRHESLVHLKKDTYPCDSCDIEFKSIYKLWTHNKEVHTEPGQKLRRWRINAVSETMEIPTTTRQTNAIPSNHHNQNPEEQETPARTYAPPPFHYSNWNTPQNLSINTSISIPGHSAWTHSHVLGAQNLYTSNVNNYANLSAQTSTSESNDIIYDNEYYEEDFDDAGSVSVPDYSNIEDIDTIPAENHIPKKRGPRPKKKSPDAVPVTPKKRPLPKRDKPCPTCGKLFRTNQRVNEHVKIHSKPILAEPLPCPDCKLTFKSAHYLSLHRVIHDPTLLPFPCKQPACNLSFNSTIKLHQHMDSAHPNPETLLQPFVCNFENCERGFQTMRLLKLHLRNHTAVKSFACSVPGCNFAFRTSSMLKRHSQIHMEDSERVRPFKCTHCDKTYIRHDGLKQHLESFHRLLPPNHQPFFCPTCFKSFEFKWNLRTHIRRIHNGKRNRPLKNPDKSPDPLFLTCDTCDWGFESRAKLKKHYLLDHEKKFGQTKYTCPKEECEKFYYLWKKLKGHILEQHDEADMQVAILALGDTGPPGSGDEEEHEQKIKANQNRTLRVKKNGRPRSSKRRKHEEDEEEQTIKTNQNRKLRVRVKKNLGRRPRSSKRSKQEEILKLEEEPEEELDQIQVKEEIYI